MSFFIAFESTYLKAIISTKWTSLGDSNLKTEQSTIVNSNTQAVYAAYFSTNIIPNENS